MSSELNVLGTPLVPCCSSPLTGYFRDGYCRTGVQDTGTHVVCAIVTTAFLEFSKKLGNDLITPIPHWNFPGLKDGDKWCLCISRWLQAERAGVAPPIIPEAIPQAALKYTTLETLQQYYHNPA